MTTAALLERRRGILGAGAPLFYRDPVHIVRGEGVAVFDAAGRRYVDMYNNVPCVGHCHPRVVAAIGKQAATLNVHSRYLHAGILDYGERLTATHHDGIESVVFTCTGTEANEVALTMARLATGGRGFIGTDAAYHGNSAALRQFTRRRAAAAPAAPALDEVRPVPFPESRGGGTEDPAAWHLARLDEAIASFRRDGIRLAGMLVCPILANEGLPNIPPGYMAAAAQRVRAAGGLFIADEVQAGLCRTGRWWGYQSHPGLAPDIVTMGKPLGAGVPLAACAASRNLVEAFQRRTGYFNTFAASPLQAAAGSAVLDVIDREDLGANASRVGAALRDGLLALQADRPAMGDVRARGLFLGVEWVGAGGKQADRDGAVAVVDAMRERGFLIGNGGACGNIVKIRPPLVCSAADAEAFLAAFADIDV